MKIFDGETLLGKTKANQEGLWNFTTKSLKDGLHDFTVKAPVTGKATSASSDHYQVTVDTKAPLAPLIRSAIDDQEALTGSIAHGGWTNDSSPELTGKAAAGTTVEIFDGNISLGSAKTNKSGVWSFSIPTPLTDGSHGFSAIATDKAGNSSGHSADFTLKVDTKAPKSPIIKVIKDDVGNMTGSIAHQGFTDDSRPVLSGKAAPGSTVEIMEEIGRAHV